MSTTPPPDRAALGRARLAERARRVARIRRNVVAATLATFALAWGVIVFDGSMGATTLASTGTSPSTAAATATASSSAAATATPSATASSSGTASTAPPAVTTGQS
jgi:hypothetical protein